jgi:hypothetical protein
MTSKENTFGSSAMALFVITFFGAALPFVVSGQIMAQKEIQIPDLSRYSVQKPYPVISDHTEYDERIIDVIDSTYRQEVTEAKNPDSVKPRYALLLRDINASLHSHLGFGHGNVSVWNSFVLLTALCVAQWATGAWFYFLSRDITKSISINFFNIGCASLAFTCLWTSCWPSLAFVNYIFYYVLPIPAICCWALYGIIYFANMSPKSWIPNLLYGFWHYSGMLVLYNLLTNFNVQWLPGAM